MFLFFPLSQRPLENPLEPSLPSGKQGPDPIPGPPGLSGQQGPAGPQGQQGPVGPQATGSLADDKLDNITAQLQGITRRFDTFERRFDAFEMRVDARFDTFERRLDASSTNNRNRKHNAAVLQGHQTVGGTALQPLQAEKGLNVGRVPPTFPAQPADLERLTGRDLDTLAAFYTVGVVMRRV